jgi:hypothetical protein
MKIYLPMTNDAKAEYSAEQMTLRPDGPKYLTRSAQHEANDAAGN